MRARGIAAYYNRTISKAKRSYRVTRRELLAIVKMLEHFYKYLCGPYFHLRTDYSALALLLS
jgi:propanediol dehydratase small subunit